MKKILIIILLVLIIFIAYKKVYSPITYTDPSQNCKIEIVPSLEYGSSDVTNAILFLKKNSPSYYNKLCSYVGVIDSGSECFDAPLGSKRVGCSYGGNKIGLTPKKDYSIQDIAVTLLHETCHFHQGHTATRESYQNPNLDTDREAECYKEQDEFLKQLH